MGQKRKKRRKKKDSAPSKHAGLRLFEHPFNRADRAGLRAAIVKKSVAMREELPVTLARVLGYFRSYDPVIVLSTLGFYGSLQGISDAGPSGRTILPHLEQHHVELLQAFAVSIVPAEHGHLPPPPGVVERIIADVETLAQLFAWSRLSSARETASTEEEVLLSLQERMRLHTQVVRNWGYVHQVRLLSTELYGSVDSELEQAIGFTAGQLMGVMSAMVRTYEERATARFKSLAMVMKERTSDGMVRAYHTEFPSLTDTADQVAQLMRNRSKPQVASMLLAHSELSLPELASFDAQLLSMETGVPDERVELILQNLCMHPGDASSSDPMHFFMDNPVWRRPGLREGLSYVFPLPQAGLSHVHRIMRRLIEEGGIKSTYELRRAKYLEDKVGDLLELAFPMARVLPSVAWSIGNDRYETDRLVVLDRAIVIVEAKSAALTAEALRGAPQRVKRHITDLVIDPARQSQRLEDVIRLSRQGDAASRRVTDEIGLDVSTVDTIVRLSITLDDFSMLATAEDDLKAVGWAPQDLSLPATLNLADFEIVIDVLERPALILHYFAERPRFQRAASLLADEMDLLGVYLHSLFNIPELDAEKTRLVASGESKPIDEYYNRLEAGMPATKPVAAIAPQVLAVIDRLAERRPPGWTTISLDLLSIGNLYQQEALWEGLETLRREVPRTEQDVGHQCAMISEPANGAAAVAFYVFTEKRAGMRRETIEQLASETLDRNGRQRFTVIGKQVEMWDEPYRIAAVAYAAQTSERPTDDSV